MNILYHFRTLGTGPEAVHISGIATAFEKLGHRVVFSSPTGVDPRKTAGDSPYRGAGRTGVFVWLCRHSPALGFELMEVGYNAVAWWRNRKILKRETFGLIYERHAFFMASTAFLARRYRLPLVVEVNELVGDARVRKQPWLTPLVRYIDRLVFRQASVIVVVSPYLKRRIESLGISGDKIIVLPNAVNVEDCDASPDGVSMRRRLAPIDEVVIGFVGWFVEWHRLDLLVDVFATLGATRPRLRLALVGEGPLKPALEAQISRLGMEGRVNFTGAVPRHEIPAMVGAMDICVVPHSNEYRSPIKLFEYMGQGKPVVAPATEPVLMVIQDGVNGLLFAPEDPDGLAKALARTADDAGLRQELGKQARRDVLEKHTWRHNAQVVLDALCNASVNRIDARKKTGEVEYSQTR